MSRSVGTPFRGKDGLHGWVEPSTGAESKSGAATNRPAGDTASWVSVKLSDGRHAYVPENAFIAQDDGTLYLPMSSADLALDPDARVAAAIRRPGQVEPARGSAADADTIQLVEERLSVGKRQVEAGVVRAHKVVRERQEAVDVPVARERVEVERVPINRVVEQAPAVRTEGDVTIIPVLEEVLVVEKRLMLREEVRLVRRREETREQQTVTLRREEVEVTRDDAAATANSLPPR